MPDKPENQSSGSVIRGSSDLHITPKAREEARALGQVFKRKGPVCRIYSSDQARALETAHEIGIGSPNAKFMTAMPDLSSWHLGGFEGQKKTDAIIKQIQDLVEKRPWAVPEGMGEGSTLPGESFLMFRNRVLSSFKQLMEVVEKQPTKRFLVVTHFHDIQMLDAWLSKYHGCPDPLDVEYDPKVYNRDIGYPLNVLWLGKGRDKWILKRLEPSLDACLPTPLPPGLYIVRHGETPWN